MTPVAILLRQHGRGLLLFAVVAAGLTWVIVGRLPPRVEVTQTFTVRIPDRPPTAEYEFDGFYALQASDLFAETLVGWLTSPDLIAEAYRGAGLPQPAHSSRRLSRIFTARKLSGQLVELRFHVRTADDARRLVDAVDRIVEQRVADFKEEKRGSLTRLRQDTTDVNQGRINDTSAPRSSPGAVGVGQAPDGFRPRGSTFLVAAHQPLVLPVQRSAPARAGVAALVAVVLAGSALILWDAFKEGSRQ